MQIAAGADAVQIFDSNGGLLADNAFETASGRWIREIITALDGRTVTDVDALRNQLARTKPDATLKVTLQR